MPPPAAPEVLIVAGEASGDHYGADLVRRIHELNPGVRFFGMGGDRMAAYGVDLLHHIKEVSVMGFVEVLSRLGPLYRSFQALTRAAERRRPAAAVLIDFPDYNLRLAPKLKQAGAARIVYYIGPTVWAWRPGRVETIRRSVDRMVVIFPFEEPIYRQAGVDCVYVGHPLVGAVRSKQPAADFRARHGLGAGTRLVGLLPGSRGRELAEHLPVLREAGRQLLARGGVELVLGLAESLDRRDVERRWGTGTDAPPLTIVENQTHEVMRHSEVVLVGCGTAPLEAAILGTPQVVIYRTSPLTFAVASRLVKVEHACIVNLILGRRAVPELLQRDLTAERLVAEASRLLDDPGARAAQQGDFAELRRRLGAAGASQRAAKAVLESAAIAIDPEAEPAAPASPCRDAARPAECSP